MIINARSLAKPDTASALHAELHSNKIDICFVSETWLNNRIPSHLVCLNGYILLRKDRAGTSNGGGVAVICRSDWQIKRLFSSDFFECVWSVITTPNSKYDVAAVCHPPDPVYAVYAVYPVYQHWRSVLHTRGPFHPGWHLIPTIEVHTAWKFLSTLKRTALGPDELPFWIWRDYAYQLRQQSPKYLTLLSRNSWSPACGS